MIPRRKNHPGSLPFLRACLKNVKVSGPSYVQAVAAESDVVPNNISQDTHGESRPTLGELLLPYASAPLTMLKHGAAKTFATSGKTLEAVEGTVRGDRGRTGTVLSDPRMTWRDITPHQK